MPTALARRTKNIKRKLNVQVTGMFDSGTCRVLENVLGLSTDSGEEYGFILIIIKAKT